MQVKPFVVGAVVAVLAALLMGAAYLMGERSGASAYRTEAMAARITAAQVAEALGSETGAWRGLTPLLSPGLKGNRQFEREVLAWQERGRPYETFAGYAIPDVIVQGRTAYAELVWEYGERFRRAKPKGSPYADWLQVLDLTFHRSGAAWRLGGVQTAEIALVTPVFEKAPWQGNDAGLVLPPVLPPPRGGGTPRGQALHSR